MRKTSRRRQMTQADPTQPDPTQPTHTKEAPAAPLRVIGALMAIVLAAGIVAGAALGPAPESSLASNPALLQRVIAALVARASGGAQTSASAASPPPAGREATTTTPSMRTTTTTPSIRTTTGKPKPASRAASPQSSAQSPSSSESAASTPSSPPGSSKESSSSGGSGETGKAAPATQVRPPPVKHVWLILLEGTTVAAASEQPASYPFLTGQLLSKGTFLSGYSALMSYELAGDTALLGNAAAQNLSLLSAPVCGEAAAGAPSRPSCVAGADPSQAGSDRFLQEVVPSILASSEYRDQGLIVIACGTVSTDAPAVAPTTTLTNEPTQGALLLSSLLRGGRSSSTSFDPRAPRKSLREIFKR